MTTKQHIILGCSNNWLASFWKLLYYSVREQTDPLAYWEGDTMTDILMVSNVENMEKLRSTVEELFKQGRYDEVSRAIGMFSLFTDPGHTLIDQSQLYHHVLDLIKNKVSTENRNNYSSWLSAFPALMAKIAEDRTAVIDKTSANALASHHSSHGPFRSVDEFFVWGLDDRRLTLDNIVKYIEKTLKMHRGKA